jgi:zinc transporter ZupT
MYRQTGRWILAAAVIAGWAIGSSTELSQAAIAVLFAFLAGGIVLNVLKEELPEDRESRFWAFAVGAIGYAALLLAL